MSTTDSKTPRDKTNSNTKTNKLNAGLLNFNEVVTSQAPTITQGGATVLPGDAGRPHGYLKVTASASTVWIPFYAA